MESNIKVIARVKPLAIEAPQDKCIHISSDREITLRLDNGLFATRRFRLDRVLDEDATQADVFENVESFLNRFISGYNCTVFMYGQTGSGKTHTMLGYDLWGMAESSPGAPLFASDESMLGIIPRSMKWIFAEMDAKAIPIFDVSVSYMELYNDMKLFDLLSPSNSPAHSLDIREAKSGEIVVPGLTQRRVANIFEVLDALWLGAQFRHVAATDMNDYSSRSHTIFVVYLSISENISNDHGIIKAKLNLVDLAGSEKWKSSQLATLSVERVKELTSINRSLSALGNCVSALMRKSRSHVPYRDSKLTRLLQDSLGGNTITLFVVTLSASPKNIEETASTLQFADRAMKVQVMVTKNSTSPINESVDKLKLEIKNLKALLHSALVSKEGGVSSADGYYSSVDVVEDLSSELQQLRDENMKVMQLLKSTQEQLLTTQEENIQLLELMGKSSPAVFPLTDASESFISTGTLHQLSDDLKVSILQARSEEIERRCQAVENMEAIQEERWGLLLNYHHWLQDQSRCDKNIVDAGVAASDVFRRVQLMEGSILVQADELRRAKKVFLQTNSELHGRLSRALQDNMRLRRRCLESAEINVSTQNETTPPEVNITVPDEAFNVNIELSDDFIADSTISELVVPSSSKEEYFQKKWGIQSLICCAEDSSLANTAAINKPMSPQTAPLETANLDLRYPHEQLPENKTKTVPLKDIGFSKRQPNEPPKGSKLPRRNDVLFGSVRNGAIDRKVNENGSCTRAPSRSSQILHDKNPPSSEIAEALKKANEIFLKQKARMEEVDESACADVNSEECMPHDITGEHPESPPPTSLAKTQNEAYDIKSLSIGERVDARKRKKHRKPKLLWQECMDHESELLYYFNRRTGETTWDKPSDLALAEMYTRDKDDDESRIL